MAKYRLLTILIGFLLAQTAIADCVSAGSDWLSNTEARISAMNALYDGSYYAAWRISVACKPVIYLYPETGTECCVKANLDGKLTCTYPDYGLNGWSDFVAAPEWGGAEVK